MPVPMVPGELGFALIDDVWQRVRIAAPPRLKLRKLPVEVVVLATGQATTVQQGEVWVAVPS